MFHRLMGNFIGVLSKYVRKEWLLHIDFYENETAWSLLTFFLADGDFGQVFKRLKWDSFLFPLKINESNVP